ncbi:MAG: site-specific DNA-methyltransferase [Candidatus Omnitrophota bacterium]
MEKPKMHTPDITRENMEKIMALFPNCVTESRDEKGELVKAIDFDLLRQEFSSQIIEGPQERYQLDWPGKRQALLTANAPIAKTLRPCREESVDFDTTKNLFIEGDNLDALKLLQETYLGKIKMIYIDPPYNTGKDFIYKDNFTKDSEQYKLESGQKDEEGNRMVQNTESNGRFHSDWLSMMYPRLKLARNLLRDDGVLFVSIDENEFINIKSICNEIFGVDNYIGEFIWKSKHGGGGDSPYIVKEHEYILVFVKKLVTISELFAMPPDDYEKMFRELDERGKFYYDRLDKKGIDSNRPNLIYPIICPDGTVKDISPAIWRLSKEEFERRKKNNEIGFRKDKNNVWQIYTKTYLYDNDGHMRRVKARSILKQEIVGFTQNGNKMIDHIFGDEIFSNSKPIELLKYFMDYITHDEREGVVLDYFSGSATTAHAVMQLNVEDGGNRKFIMVQLPEPCAQDSETFKAGYKTIAEIGKERIRRAGKKIKEENKDKEGIDKLDIGFRVLKVDSTNMAEVYYKPDEVKKEQIEMFADNIKKDRTSEDLLFQVLLDWGVDLTFPITREEIQDKEVFFVDGNVLAACFKATGDITEDFVKELAKRKPLRVVFRDAGFKDDSVKINVEQIFKLMSPQTEVRTI